MDPQELNRRDFHRLTMAAVGGVLAGTVAGCGGEDKPAPPPKAHPQRPPTPNRPSRLNRRARKSPRSRGIRTRAADSTPARIKGPLARTTVPGNGVCATKAWHHSCGGQNDCKGQGGCGETATMNDCKQKEPATFH